MAPPAALPYFSSQTPHMRGMRYGLKFFSFARGDLEQPVIAGLHGDRVVVHVLLEFDEDLLALALVHGGVERGIQAGRSCRPSCAARFR